MTRQTNINDCLKEGRLKIFPAKKQKKIIVLDYLISKFEKEEFTQKKR